MEVRILGALEVAGHSAPVDLGGRRQRAVLAVLVVHANQVVSVDRLAEDAWEGSPPAVPAKALQPHVSRLRKALAAVAPGRAVLENRSPGYVVRLAPDELDAWRFKRLLDDGRAALAEGRAEAALERLSAGLALWRGPVLADLAFFAFAHPESNRLEELRRATVEDVIEARLLLGHQGDLVAELEALVAEHPLRERLWGQRMLALYRCGRQAEALRAYQDLRRRLADEIGIEPGPELKRLEGAILLHRPELDWTPRRPRPSGPGDAERGPVHGGSEPHHRPGNLPLRLTTFVGRAAEQAEIAARLSTTRMLTLTGSGGCGKSRLAYQVAGDIDVADGVWLADVSPLSDPGLVPGAIATSLGVREQPGRPLVDTLAAELATRVILIVLDNCEHLLAACADVAGSLLARCPDLRVLATSREPLGVPGEVAWRVPSLSLPAAGPDSPYDAIVASEAVQLFVDRARHVAAGFSVNPANAPTVALICQRLDGIALAVELAAARAAVLSLTEIEARLDDCFRLLNTGGRTFLARQQTLEAAVRWSYDLLSDSERILLDRLSVFAGGFTLQVAEMVCSGGGVDGVDVFDLVAQLHTKSLLMSDTTGAESRYRLLDTIRQFGRDRLAESGGTDDVRARHAAWYAELAELAEPELTGGSQAAWLERLEAEHDNLRAALHWAVGDGRGTHALRLAGALSLFWRVRGHFTEGRDWLQRAQSVSDGGPAALRAKAHWGEGFLAGMLGDWEGGLAVVTESLALYREVGDTQGCARSLLLLGNFRQFTDGPPAALPLLEESLVLARQACDMWCLAHSLALCGWVHMNRGDLTEARPLLEECLAVARPAKEEQSVAMGLHLLGWTALLQGDYGLAEDLLNEGLAVYRRLGESYGTAMSLMLLGELTVARGEYRQGRILLDQVLALIRRMGSPGVIAYCLCLLGRLAQAESDVATAQAYFEEAMSVTGEASQSRRPALAGLGAILQSLGDLPRARVMFEEALSRAKANGNQLEVAQALHDIGNLARAEDDDGGAASFYEEALRLRTKVGNAPGVADSLDALAGVAVAAGRLRDGARLFGAAESLRTAGGYIRHLTERRRIEADLSTLQDGLDATELQAAWAEGASEPGDVAAAVVAPTPQ